MKTHRLFAIAAVILCLYTAVVLAQQQAAEAPASGNPLQTRPVVTGLHGIVAAGHSIACFEASFERSGRGSCFKLPLI
jgi:hypothetical protein